MIKSTKMTLTQKLLFNIKKVFTLKQVRADEPQAGAQPQAGVGAGAGAPVQTQAQPGATTQTGGATAGAVQNQPAYGAGFVQTPQVNIEQLMTQVRQEEKNKLYPEINGLKATNSALVAKNNDLMLQLGTKDATIAELNAQLETARNSVTESKEYKDLLAENNTLKSENETLKAEAQKFQLKGIIDGVVAQYQGKIIPELVTGTTKEEIEASAKKSNERYLQLFGGVQQQAQQTQQSQVGYEAQQQQSMFNTQPNTQYQTPVANPNAVGYVGATQATVSDEAVRGMTMEQYAQYRKQMGIGRR